MKLLLEHWRKYLLNERYSIESGLATIKPDNKKMYNLFKRVTNAHWHEGVATGVLDPKWDPEPKVPEEKIRKAAAAFRAYILDLIPQDIWGQHATTEAQRKKEADKNQGLAIMWIRKLSIENPKIAADIIAGDIYYGIYNRVMPNLEIYFQNLDLMPKRNLIELESFEELHQMVEAAKEEIYARQDKKQYLDAEQGTEVLHGKYERNEKTKKLERKPGKSGWFIAVIHNKGAACELGKQSDWCTATDTGYFEEYYEPDDPLFFFEGFWTDPSTRFQFHYGSESFMDVGDSPVDKETFNTLHSQLMQTDAPQKYPVLQTYSYKLKADDPNTSPEELSEIAETLMSSGGALSSDHTWEREVLSKIAKNSKTPLETLRKLSKLDDKYVVWSLSANPQWPLNDSPEGLKEHKIKIRVRK